MHIPMNPDERNAVRVGMAGRLATAFINSKLTPLIILASLLLGGFAVLKTPREEEPQIVVPMIDVLVSMPGASAQEVERRITTPMEKLVWEIPGVEYVYSTSSPGQSMVIVRYLVGQNQEASLVKLLACRSAELVTREALQLYGGMGYAEESAVSRYFVDARVLSIFEGAEETLALKVIGRSLLEDALKP